MKRDPQFTSASINSHSSNDNYKLDFSRYLEDDDDDGGGRGISGTLPMDFENDHVDVSKEVTCFDHRMSHLHH